MSEVLDKYNGAVEGDPNRAVLVYDAFQSKYISALKGFGLALLPEDLSFHSSFRHASVSHCNKEKSEENTSYSRRPIRSDGNPYRTYQFC